MGNACADAAIQALGGYGYMREYDVEKIKRDVKITTIYEGTSEIMQLIISTFRWRETVKSKGAFYETLAQQMDEVHCVHADIKADTLATIIRLLNKLIEEVHKAKLTRQQHVMFELASLATLAETGAALYNKLDREPLDDELPLSTETRDYLKLCARINTAYCGQEASRISAEVMYGSGHWTVDDAQAVLASVPFDCASSQSGLIGDLDLLKERI